MFGMGFTEILIIVVIAILFLGPDKLPGAMVDIAKFFKNAKNTINTVKDSFEHEMEATGIKAEALAYKKELENAQKKLNSVTNINNTLSDSIASIGDDILNATEDDTSTKKAPKQEQEVTFKKKTNTDDKEDIKNV